MTEFLAWLREHVSAGGAAAGGFGIAVLAWIKAGGWAWALRLWRQYREVRAAAKAQRRDETANQRERDQAAGYQQLLSHFTREIARLEDDVIGPLRRALAACEARDVVREAEIEQMRDEARRRDARIEWIEQACPNCPARRLIDASE